MAVTETDVRKIATLARLQLPHETLATVVTQLNDILGHMDVLNKVDTTSVAPTTAVGGTGMPLRDDTVAPIPMQATPAELTAESRDGFILVPRLSTHGDV